MWPSKQKPPILTLNTETDFLQLRKKVPFMLTKNFDNCMPRDGVIHTNGDPLFLLNNNFTGDIYSSIPRNYLHPIDSFLSGNRIEFFLHSTLQCTTLTWKKYLRKNYFSEYFWNWLFNCKVCLELSELLVEHIMPSAAAEAPLQHPLPCPRHHQQWKIDHRCTY